MKLLAIPSAILPYIIMAGFFAKVIRSHPMAIKMFPIMFILRRPQRSIAIPPSRQPTGLEIAYTLAETREIFGKKGLIFVKNGLNHSQHIDYVLITCCNIKNDIL
jgi:hypothetical protein